MEDIHDSKIFTDFKNKFSLIGDNVECNTLYQYTHSSTIINLINTNVMWGTSYKNLNDPTELNHGLSFFLPAIYDFLAKITDLDMSKFQNQFENEMSSPRIKLFVSSFTENKDLLSQWRGYGDYGQGLSIGLNPNEFKFAEDQTSFWVKVIYDDIQKEAIVSAIFNHLKQLYINQIVPLKEYSDADKIRAILLSLIQISLVNSIKFKDKSWSEEQEWRLVKLHFGKNCKPIKVRTRDHHLIEFYEFDFVSNVATALNEIVIGPRSNQLNQKMALESLLSGSKIKIIYSKIPWV